LRQEHRDQPEGRTGAVIHRLRFRRAAAGRRMNAAADISPTDAARRDERKAMGVACGAHALHDGYTDLIYVMLPIWQAEFGLSYAAIGALRGVFAGTMAGFQIPAGLLSERIGTPLVLAAGTALAARAFAGPRSLSALGTYNFAGDLGKMALPAAASLLVVVMPWRPTLAILGLIGLVAAFAIFAITP